jgi:isopentenyl diphosphate isomerase/L-lactate dehydrogenase-like FMN-dependent dehydrogenase
MLTGAYPPDTSTEVLGTSLTFPVLVAPWAYQGMAHPDGELATARAAARAGTIMVVSSTAMEILEDVAGASDGPKWWQLYVFTDRGLTAEMLARVHAAGYGAICFTVDFPVAGLRHRDTRSGFRMPLGIPGSELVYDPKITWDDLAWIRDRAPLPLLVKGVMTAEDARIAVETGADGVIVSNHGARQLDRVAATVTVLPEVVDAVAGRVPIMLDGGIRRGTDVFTALALGASAVLVGRPAAWGLAVAGEEGVADVLGILRDEFENTMTLAGVGAVAEITSSFVAPA